MKVKHAAVSCTLVVIFFSHKGTIATQDKPPLELFVHCSFEDGMCGWNNISAGWKTGQGLSAKSGTGPTNDHTFRNESGRYLYLDSKSINTSQSQMLQSPLVHSNESCLSLWYHLRGNDTGNLTISIETNVNTTGKSSLATHSGTRTILWSQEGELEDKWYRVEVTIQTQEDFRVSLEGTTKGSRGKIAIDDIKLYNYSCNDTCSFDDDYCSWIQNKDDGFRWNRTSGSKFSKKTGPQSGHTNGTAEDYYMHIDASLGNESTKAVLRHTGLYRPGKACLSFWYHMYGEHMGKLNLYAKRNGNSATPLWCKTGDQGNKWTFAVVDVDVGPNVSVEFEAIRGNGTRGDMALDDISLTTVYCNGTWATSTTRDLKESTVSVDGEETGLSTASLTKSQRTRSGSPKITQQPNSPATGTWATSTARDLKESTVSADGKDTELSTASLTESQRTSSESPKTTQQTIPMPTVNAIIGTLGGAAVFVVVSLLIGVRTCRKLCPHSKKVESIRLQPTSCERLRREDKREDYSSAVQYINPGYTHSSNAPHPSDTAVINVKIENENYEYASAFNPTTPTYWTDDIYDTTYDETKPHFDGTYDHMPTNVIEEHGATHLTIHTSFKAIETYDHVTMCSDDVYDKTYVMTQATDLQDKTYDHVTSGTCETPVSMQHISNSQDNIYELITT